MCNVIGPIVAQCEHDACMSNAEGIILESIIHIHGVGIDKSLCGAINSRRAGAC